MYLGERALGCSSRDEFDVLIGSNWLTETFEYFGGGQLCLQDTFPSITPHLAVTNELVFGQMVRESTSDVLRLSGIYQCLRIL